MHSPTLFAVAAILLALVTSVLHAVWHFNRQIPGLRLWAQSYLAASAFCITLLLRNQLPEAVSVVLAQTASALSVYLCWLGSRDYMRQAPVAHRYAAGAFAVLLAISLFFTVVQPDVGARFALLSFFVGVFYLLTARTLARGPWRDAPARWLLAGVMCLHGVWVLVRPALFGLADPSQVGMLGRLPQFVVLESTVASVLIAFGVLMLANEHVTRELRHLAEVDPLTSVFNRRAFLTLIDKGLSHAQREGVALPVLVMDLDHFKKINDTWGHRCGDEVLRHFTRLSLQCLRNEDVMGRLGGEEFAIFLPGANDQGAAAVAERLRALLEAKPLDVERRIALTVSIGVALSVPGDTAESILQRADEAMYLAKARGRNRVELLLARAAEPLPA